LGNATLLLDDGETQLLTDGFFSRPGLLKTVLGPVHSNPDIVQSCLQRSAVTRLAAVFCLHTHYDHVLDAPTVALRTGAQLLGSASTAMVGRGSGVPENRLIEVSDSQSYSFGRFTVTPYRSGHVPPERLTGTIDSPLAVPARVTSYRMGTCYSLLVEHGVHRLLIQGSAGAVPGVLDRLEVDVVYLAVGALGKQSADYRRRYWNDVVGAVGARRILPIHWDDFSKPLSEDLVPLPYLVDNFDQTLRFLDERAAESGVEVNIPQAWVAVDPFAQLR
jgi:L-ascorbate metabolism protein UlaG (beta-lactamase superfamily)